MARRCLRAFYCILISLALAGCAASTTREPFKPETADSVAPRDETAGQSPDSFAVDPERLEFGQYMEEEVDNFLVVIDASASKYLPYHQQTKLKVAKDILRRFNQRTPDRPLFGGLRRYGWEAGAFTTQTSLLYGMTRYDREDYADAIEIIRWAGGKSPMAMVIDRAGDDLALAPQDEYLALVIVSDGKIMKSEPDPVMAARRVKERFGDRICIYTVAVGDDAPFDRRTLPENQKIYREKFGLLRDIAREGKCGYMVTSDDLIPDKNMDQFVHDVFHRGRTLEKAPCPDEDGDGVCDDADKCPGTPKGAKVDENGCWILGKVQFDLNKWNVKPQYFAMLDDIARVLKLNPDVRLAVQGHTCTIWTEEYNMKLSYWRAQSVQAYLVNRGVNPGQLVVEGYGFHKPFAPNDTDQGRILNRRVEFQRLQ